METIYLLVLMNNGYKVQIRNEGKMLKVKVIWMGNGKSKMRVLLLVVDCGCG